MNKKAIGYIINEAAGTIEPRESKIVGESKNGMSVIEAVLQDMNIKNRNGRFYDAKDLVPQITSERTLELLRTGFKGENGHPMTKEIVRQSTIDPNNVCCKYLKLWVQGNDIMALVRGTNNQLGRDFDADIKDGESPAFSLRALGTVENTTRGAEVKNIKIITWDRVYYPSHKRAYMTKLVNESAVVDDKERVAQTESGILIPITNDKVIDYIKQESTNLKSIVETFEFLYDDISILENGNSVQITDNVGTTFIVNLESYIQNEISNYCFNNY